MEVIILFFIAHWYLSLFFQTFFLHRYAAHKAFTMSPFMEKVFFVLTWFFQGSNYLSAYGYGVMHRMHHAFADTPNDPHSPKYDESFRTSSDYGWSVEIMLQNKFEIFYFDEFLIKMKSGGTSTNFSNFFGQFINDYKIIKKLFYKNIKNIFYCYCVLFFKKFRKIKQFF